MISPKRKDRQNAEEAASPLGQFQNEIALGAAKAGVSRIGVSTMYWHCYAPKQASMELLKMYIFKVHLAYFLSMPSAITETVFVM